MHAWHALRRGHLLPLARGVLGLLHGQLARHTGELGRAAVVLLAVIVDGGGGGDGGGGEDIAEAFELGVLGVVFVKVLCGWVERW